MHFCVILALLLGVVDIKSMDTDSEKTSVKRDSVCYGDLGCFSTDAPFTNAEEPVAVIPQSPDTIVTRYLLYTRESRTVAQALDARHPDTVSTTWTRFQQRPTQILIHGFLDTVSLTTMWMDMKDELLAHGDYNVVLVDWSHGNEAPYDQACANARLVGAQIAALVKALISGFEVSASSFHIIGHSLGAHVCGYAGEKIPGLGRITGLDPAGPYFENTERVVRLDETDAVFVDIIHTDAKNLLQLGLGTKTQSGHADFYPNMGHDQPECTYDPITNIIGEGILVGVEDTLACSHIRAVKYFTESINTQCPFYGFPCGSEDDFKNNLCHTCTEAGCARFGFEADKHKPAAGSRVKYYLSTAGHKPFCQYHLTVTVKLNYDEGDEERGVLDLVVTGSNGTTGKIQLTGDSDPTNYSPGHTYTFYVMIPNNFGNVQSVTFTWTHKASLLDPLHWDILGLQHPKLYLDEVDIFREEAGVDVHLCGSGLSVETGKSLTISSKCSAT
ncbi:hypothetical protein BsWGS_02488 [Bradybaena similaris]